MASIYAGKDAGAVQVVASADGRFAFFSNEQTSSIAVISLNLRAEDTAPNLAMVGAIGVDPGPVGLAISPDGRKLFATSQIARRLPKRCDGAPEGSLSIVDVATAESHPRSVAVSSVAAGCQPVRVAVSPNGESVWVTARGDDQLEVFDAKSLLDDAAHALLAKASVGSAPVGLLVTADGKFILVANSNRFDLSARHSTVSILDAQAVRNGRSAVINTVETGGFPRELRESPRRDAIYLTNYTSGTVQVLAEPGAPEAGRATTPLPY